MRAFLLKFSNRTAAACHDVTSPNARRMGVARVPPSEPCSRVILIGTGAARQSRPKGVHFRMMQSDWPVRANVPARGVGPRVHDRMRPPDGDKVRARNDPYRDHAAHYFRE